MNNCNNKQITKEVIEDLEGVVFVDRPNFEHYDIITIGNGFIEIVKEEVWERDEELNYNKVADEEVRQFQKDSISGVYKEI
jgi:hypothetical protein